MTMRKPLLALSAFFALSISGCLAQSVDSHGTLIRDDGGRLVIYADRADTAMHQLRIPMHCASACTILLAARHGACLQPNGWIAVHSSYDWARREHGGPWAGMSQSGNDLIRHYYARLSKAVYARLSPLLDNPWLTQVDNSELIALGMNACRD
jgi:hypothetical protein